MPDRPNADRDFGGTQCRIHSARLSRTLTKEDIEPFAVMSGDVNPVCVDEEFARDDMFHKLIAHGMWGGRASRSKCVRLPLCVPRTSSVLISRRNRLASADHDRAAV